MLCGGVGTGPTTLHFSTPLVYHTKLSIFVLLPMGDKGTDTADMCSTVSLSHHLAVLPFVGWLVVLCCVILFV